MLIKIEPLFYHSMYDMQQAVLARFCLEAVPREDYLLVVNWDELYVPETGLWVINHEGIPNKWVYTLSGFNSIVESFLQSMGWTGIFCAISGDWLIVPLEDVE